MAVVLPVRVKSRSLHLVRNRAESRERTMLLSNTQNLVYGRDRSGSGWIDLSGRIVAHFDAIPKAAIHDRLQRVAMQSSALREDPSYEKFWDGIGREAAPVLAIRVAAVRHAGHKFAARAALTVPPTETVMPKIPAINPLLQAWLLEGPLSAQVPA